MDSTEAKGGEQAEQEVMDKAASEVGGSEAKGGVRFQIQLASLLPIHFQLASSYLRDQRVADLKKKQEKQKKYVRWEAARKARQGKTYRPKGK